MYFDFCVLLNADLTTPLVSFVKALPGLPVSVCRPCTGSQGRAPGGWMVLASAPHYSLQFPLKQCQMMWNRTVSEWEMSRTLRKVCSVVQLSLPFHYTHRSGTVDYVGIALGCFFCLCFWVCFVLFMLRANLMAHCSRFFREGMRQNRTALGVDPWVLMIRLGVRNHCWVTSISQYKDRKESHCTRVSLDLYPSCTCIQAACGAFKFSSQAERDWKGRRDQ